MRRYRTMRRSFLFFFLLAPFASVVANNIQVTNASLTSNDGNAGQCFVQFDLAWENSWRGGGAVNNDAAWVFAKFRTSNGIWQHVRLGNTGHIAAAGSQIDPGLLAPASAFNATTNPVMGTFVRRSAEGSGTFTVPGMQLRWPYAAQGLSFNDIVEVRVYAIEMVLVPTGVFAAGSGGSELNAFELTTITTANAATPPSGTGSLGGQAGGHPSNSTPGGNAAYPNGFNAYYCMKYELTQQQYVDFLNTLTRAQQQRRVATNVSGTSVTNRFVMSNTATILNRNGIRCDGTLDATAPIAFYCDANGNGVGGESTDGLWRACNFLSFVDLGSYLGWSGLRPMTELEFEKACRGGLLPVANEFAWGTTSISAAAYTVSNNGTANEGISTGYGLLTGNAAYTTTASTLNGPVRVGVFAGNANNNGRITSGAGSFGIMELSGNANEFVVDLWNFGRSFTGTHGDGSLNLDGAYTAVSWPSAIDGSGATIRGGSFLSSTSNMRTSDRSAILQSGWGFRTSVSGGRGVRTAP